MSIGNVKAYNVMHDIEITVDPDLMSDGIVTLRMPDGKYEGWLLVFLLSQKGVVLNKNKLNTFRVTSEVADLTLQKGHKELQVSFAEIRAALRAGMKRGQNAAD